jgi:hypothetical protein
MGEILGQIALHPGQMGEIVRLAVAPGEARETYSSS